MTGGDGTGGPIEGEGARKPVEIAYDVDADERHSEAAVRATAAALDASPLDLDPLYDVIDPDHVDETFERSKESTNTNLTLTFNGCTVTIAGEEIHVRSRVGDTAES